MSAFGAKADLVNSMIGAECSATSVRGMSGYGMWERLRLRLSRSGRDFLDTRSYFNIDSAARDSYLALFNVSKILPFIRRAISAAGSGFWHSDSGLSQKLELGNISNRLRAGAPRQGSGSFT